jgi:hypothetical protein
VRFSVLFGDGVHMVRLMQRNSCDTSSTWQRATSALTGIACEVDACWSKAILKLTKSTTFTKMEGRMQIIYLPPSSTRCSCVLMVKLLEVRWDIKKYLQ